MRTARRVLAVEDDRVNRELAVELVEQEGHEVLSADRARAGLVLAVRKRPDLKSALEPTSPMKFFQMAGNRWLTQLLLQLEPLIGRVHHISFRRPGRMEQSTREHRSIVDAVTSRDAKAARQAMHEHLLLVEQNVIEILEAFVVPWEGDRL